MKKIFLVLTLLAATNVEARVPDYIKNDVYRRCDETGGIDKAEERLLYDNNFRRCVGRNAVRRYKGY